MATEMPVVTLRQVRLYVSSANEVAALLLSQNGALSGERWSSSKGAVGVSRNPASTRP
jgi:hypothetical protein